MVRWAALLPLVCLLVSVAAAQPSAQPKPGAAPKGKPPMKLVYPESPRVEQVDDYHGVPIADPYRWLEDPADPRTKTWIEAQNKLTFGYLEQLPQREPFRKRLTALWNYERYGLPRKRGSRYFFTRNDGLQNQAVVYVAEGLTGEPRVLLDPNTLAQDGTVALTNWVPSDDGSLLAYGVASAGSDWQEWKVLDVATGQPRPDHLKWIKFSGASWDHQGKGFYYSRYDEPPPGAAYTGANYFQKLYYHRLGDPQQEDRLVYERQDQKEWGFSGDVTEDGRYLVITVWRGTEQKNQIFSQDLTRADAPVVELLTGWDAQYHFLGNVGSQFYFTTDKEAPLKRVIALSLERPQPAHWREVVPESKETLLGAGLVGGKLVAEYLQDAVSEVRVHELNGRLLRKVELPGLGSAGGFGGRQDDPETFYSFTSYTAPGSIYRYDITNGKSEFFRAPKVDFDPTAFEAKQFFYASKDGTRVPLTVVHRRGLALDGAAPTILYGYGGFNVSQTPGFSVSTIAWLEAGGVYAVANLRGGGEYGRSWHEAGMLGRKQNVFDDFLAAAEWLIDHKYTQPKKLAIRGGSNGGLLVGAALTQRPDLFGAAVPAVGVLDMLRYHRFTIGWAWVPEYGSADHPEQFKTLRAYSPLHNLQAGASYPAVLVTTADHDDRVVPAHSFKFAAALQAATAGERPALIRIETKAGHGAGTPTSKLIESSADVLAFLAQELGVEAAP